MHIMILRNIKRKGLFKLFPYDGDNWITVKTACTTYYIYDTRKEFITKKYYGYTNNYYEITTKYRSGIKDTLIQTRFSKSRKSYIRIINNGKFSYSGMLF